MLKTLSQASTFYKELRSVKIFCHVHGKPAAIVGYGPGRKGRPRAIVITEGHLKDVALKDIELDLDEMAMQVTADVTPFRKRRA